MNGRALSATTLRPGSEAGILAVDRGKADGMFINTVGMGWVVAPTAIEPNSVRPGDTVILSGEIGRHGIAVMAAREGLAFETSIASGCAPLAAPVLDLIEAGIAVHCLRDLTRGGLASAPVEVAKAAQLAVFIEEQSIPVGAEVAAACELLGLEPYSRNPMISWGRGTARTPSAPLQLCKREEKDKI
jgi:hydrogenase expression/formation protein HypE